MGYSPCLALRLEHEGEEVPWAGFLVFSVGGRVGLRPLNPNLAQQGKDDSKLIPRFDYVKQRYVSGRGFMFRKQRDGMLLGHFFRVLDHTNVFGMPWLPSDLLTRTKLTRKQRSLRCTASTQRLSVTLLSLD